jgi:hypothetical protein
VKYKLSNQSILRDDGSRIPLDDQNRDYQEYLAWLAAGNIPDPVDVAPDVISISTDSPIIIGDGIDEILLGVQGRENIMVTINVLTGTTPSAVNVQLDEFGNGSQLFSCETSPTVIVFSHDNITLKVRAL